MTAYICHRFIPTTAFLVNFMLNLSTDVSRFILCIDFFIQCEFFSQELVDLAFSFGTAYVVLHVVCNYGEY